MCTLNAHIQRDNEQCNRRSTVLGLGPYRCLHWGGQARPSANMAQKREHKSNADTMALDVRRPRPHKNLEPDRAHPPISPYRQLQERALAVAPPSPRAPTTQKRETEAEPRNPRHVGDCNFRLLD